MSHHYIIGIMSSGVLSDTPGKLSTDFIVHYTDEDVEKLKITKTAVENKLFGCSLNDALRIAEVRNIPGEIDLCSIRVRLHDMIVCHFVTEEEIEREFWNTYVSTTPIEELKKALIHLN